MPNAARNNAVFINCPFDDVYAPLLRAIVFAIHACGYRSWCALGDNGGDLRLERLKQYIQDCDQSIHDLSRVELSDVTATPRFNMAFELGVAIGARMFGGRRQKLKRTLVLARSRESWAPSISDLAGVDPVFHENSERQVVKAVRDFLGKTPEDARLPSATALWSVYSRFSKDLPQLANKAGYTLEEAREYVNFVEFVVDFLKEAK